MSEICVRGHELFASIISPVEGLTDNKDIITLSEWITIISSRLKDNLRLVSDSLISTASIVVPLWDVSKTSYLVIKGSALRTKSDT